jgi:hypothetical protein
MAIATAERRTPAAEKAFGNVITLTLAHSSMAPWLVKVGAGAR